MSNTICRIAAVQLTCHPAITRLDQDFLGEPVFPPVPQASLADLGRSGANVTAIRSLCREEYCSWHGKRLQKVLEVCAEENADIVVMPEASTPLECLPEVRAMSQTTHARIFAGTHTFRLGEQAKQVYLKAGFSSRQYEQLSTAASAGQRAVAPLFVDGKAFYYLKRYPSVLERTEIDLNPAAVPEPNIVPLKVRGIDLSIGLLVCSEALQSLPNPPYPDVFIIEAFDNDPMRFEPIIAHLTRQGRVVVFVNDGRSGGSGIHFPIDRRPRGWLYDHPLNGSLPGGDAVIVSEHDVSLKAVQAGVNNPSVAGRLVRLAPLIFESSPNDIRAFFLAARNSQEVGALRRHAVQVEEDQTNDPALSLCRPLVRFLQNCAEVDSLDVPTLNAYGKHISVDAVALESVEQAACAKALVALDQALPEDSQDFGTIGKVEIARRVLSKRVGETKSAADLAVKKTRVRTNIVNRSEELRWLREFAKHRDHTMLQLTGMDGVGKRSLVEAFLEKYGYSNAVRIQVSEGAGADQLVRSVFEYSAYPLSISDEDNPARLLTTKAVEDVLKRHKIVFISHAHNWLREWNWRDFRVAEALSALVATAHRAKSKIIVVADYPLDNLSCDMQYVARRRVHGLADDHGLDLLCTHLRRNHLDPSDFREESLRQLVKASGGHPAILILLSEHLRDRPLDALVADVKGRGKFFESLVRRLIQRLPLSQDQIQSLALLTELEVPVDAQLLFEMYPKLMEHGGISRLVEAGLIERERDDRVIAAPILLGCGAMLGISAKTRMPFHEKCLSWLEIYRTNAQAGEKARITAAISYHATVCGKRSRARLDRVELDGLLSAARRAYRVGEYDRTLEIVLPLLQVSDRPELYELAGLASAREGKFDDVVDFVRSFLEREPRRVDVLLEVGGIALGALQYEIVEALANLAQAALGPAPAVYTLRGRMELQLNHLAQAREALERAIQLDPYGTWPYYYLAKVYRKQYDFESAVRTIQRVPDSPSNRRARKSRGAVALQTLLVECFIDSDQLDKAEGPIANLLRSSPDDVHVARVYGLYRRKGGKKLAPGAHLENAISQSSGDRRVTLHDKCSAHLFLALGHLSHGNAGEAIEELDRAHKMDPSNVFVCKMYAKSLFEAALGARADGEEGVARAWARQAKTVNDRVLLYVSDDKEARNMQIDMFRMFQI